MKVFLLCGGAGTRFDNIYPKPLNLINGIPMIYYVIEKINIDTIHIIYNTILDKYDFKQYLINSFKNKQFIFIDINYQTRGAAETLYIGLKNIEINEQILVLDNDNIYNDLEFINLPLGNFILYNKNPTGLTHYSFVKLEDNTVISIEERKQISDFICVGGYCFENSITCKQYCKDIILNSNDDEPFLSKVFAHMLSNNIKVYAHYLPNVFSIGTPKDVLINKKS